jgi:deoxyribonuclease-4
VHPGSYTDSRPELAVREVIDSVKQAVKRLPATSMRILIENTAGMGSAVGSRLEEVGEIVAGLSAIGVGACLDTAHLFAAGYDIRTPGGLESTIEMIDQTIGLHNVPVIHANDSKIALGGRVDRHEHIGKGKIGAEAFRRILTHPRLGASYPEGVPGRAFIAETPIDDPGDDRKDVAALWELAGLSEKAPAAEKGYSMLTAAGKKKAAELAKAAKKKKAK